MQQRHNLISVVNDFLQAKTDTAPTRPVVFIAVLTETNQ